MTQMIKQMAASPEAVPPKEHLRRTADSWACAIAVEGRSAGEPLSQVDARWVGQVRRIVTARLRLLGLIRLQDDLLLIVSEVMTNAVTHAGYGGPGSVTFVQRLAGGRLRIEVSDTGRGRPEIKAPSTTEESGRGLHLVDNLTGELGGRWGFDPDHRTTWIDLPTAPAAG